MEQTGPGAAAEVLTALHRIMGPDGELSIEAFRDRIQDLLAATRTTKDGRELPEDRSRMLGMQLWERMIDRCLAYGIGLPVQRVHTIEEKRGMSPEEQLDQFRENPAHFLATEREMRRMRRLLESEGVIDPEIEA